MYVTMMNLLSKKSDIPLELFRSYWQGAHMQIAARLPGIYHYSQNHLSYAEQSPWPDIEGVGSDLAADKRFSGEAEMGFMTRSDYDSYLASVSPLMRDEVNLFDETVSYLAYGDNATTFVDSGTGSAPEGGLSGLRLMIYYQKVDRVDLSEFREWLTGAARALAGAEEVLKLRLRLVEEYDNSQVKLDAPGVSHYKAREDQYQAGMEVAFGGQLSLRSFASCPAWRSVAREYPAYVRSHHVFRIDRKYEVYRDGELTIAGLRTPAVAEDIRQLRATNQFDSDVVQLLMAAHPASRVVSGEGLGPGTGSPPR